MVLEVLNIFHGSLNIVSDSVYVVNAVRILEVAGVIKTTSPLCMVFSDIQKALLERRAPVYITHIRAHSGLPGPMSKGNDLADRATRLAAVVLQPPLEAAKNFHETFHVTAETLRHRFNISRKEARHIVTTCQNCCEFLPVPHVGLTPRDTTPTDLADGCYSSIFLWKVTVSSCLH